VDTWDHSYPSVSKKRRTEWFRLIAMIISLELITYGKYLNDTAAKFKEADENDEVHYTL
jgi:hypothetical protein